MAKGWRLHHYELGPFGRRVKELKQRLGVSYERLARMSGVAHKSSMQQVAEGKRSIPEPQRRRLVEVLVEQAQARGLRVSRRELLASAALAPIAATQPVRRRGFKSPPREPEWPETERDDARQRRSPLVDEVRLASKARLMLDMCASDLDDIRKGMGAEREVYSEGLRNHNDHAGRIVAQTLLIDGATYSESGRFPAPVGRELLRQASELAHEIGNGQLEYYARWFIGLHHRKQVSAGDRELYYAARATLEDVAGKAPTPELRAGAHSELGKLWLAVRQESAFQEAMQEAERELALASGTSQAGLYNDDPWSSFMPAYFQVMVRETNERGLAQFSTDPKRTLEQIRSITGDIRRFPAGLTVNIDKVTTRLTEAHLLLLSQAEVEREDGLRIWADCQRFSKDVGYGTQLFRGKQVIQDPRVKLPARLSNPCRHCRGTVLLERDDAAYKCVACSRVAVSLA